MQLTFDELSTSPGGQDRPGGQDNLFLNPEHKQLYEEYIRRDGTHPQDRERKSFFYLFTGCPDLISKSINRIYDFNEHMLRIDPSEEKDLSPFSLCSSSKAILFFGCHLYNSRNASLSITDTFFPMGEDNIHLIITAIRIRFDRNVHI